MYEFLVSGLFIWLDRDSVTLFQRKDCPLQVCDVLIGPFDFESSVSELGRHMVDNSTIGYPER